MKVLHVIPSDRNPNLEKWKGTMAMPTWDGKIFYFYDIDFPEGFPLSEIKHCLSGLFPKKCTMRSSVKHVEM